MIDQLVSILGKTIGQFEQVKSSLKKRIVAQSDNHQNVDNLQENKIEIESNVILEDNLNEIITEVTQEITPIVNLNSIIAKTDVLTNQMKPLDCPTNLNLSITQKISPKTSETLIEKAIEKKIENTTDKTPVKKLLNSYTFINCDVNYFNFEYLVSKTGGFDIIMMDPPWRIKGGQKNDSQFMFANNKFCLEYDTMSNDQIALLDIKCLSKKGFMFLWILGNQINIACKMLNKWGYDLVDLIIWVKTKRGKVYLSHGYYLMHSYEICLVGYKCPTGQHVEYFSKVSNNLIFSEVTGKSQKPVEIYEIIEMMMPGARKLEIFARNNNLRKGWMSLGNQLGEEFHHWTNRVNCDGCHTPLLVGLKRYKSRTVPNFDLCERCFSKGVKSSKKINQQKICSATNGYQTQIDKLVNDLSAKNKKQDQICINKGSSNTIQKDSLLKLTTETLMNKSVELSISPNQSQPSFFELQNQVSERVLHKFHSCNFCEMNPIWGLRFTCKDCPNFDLCEGCFDKTLFSPDKFHPKGHQFRVTEMQKLSLGFQTHLTQKCASCYQKPIIGVCFKCTNCTNLSLCQKCFFRDQSLSVKQRKSHKPEHNWEFFIKPDTKMTKINCGWCQEENAAAEYQCDICFDFGLCSVCHMKKSHFKVNKATTHKAYHTFTKIK